MRFSERNTVKAIGELRRAYPYAAALLSYVVVERVLKRYAARNWTNPAFAAFTIPKKVKVHGGKAVRDLYHLTPKERLDDILCELTLGEVEQLLGRPEHEKCAGARNDLVHSKLYLKAESGLLRPAQGEQNRNRFLVALDHLRSAAEMCEGFSIVDRKSALTAQPNQRLKLAGASK